MKRIFSVILLTVMLLATFASCAKPANESGSSESSISSTAETDKKFYPGQRIERETWNIELEFVKVTDTAIIVEMRDYDNKSFYMNDVYFVLERLENGEWIKIVDPDISESYDHENLRRYCVPHPELEVAVSWSHDLYSERTPGHYRKTKILKDDITQFSGKEFSVEFDLT